MPAFRSSPFNNEIVESDAPRPLAHSSEAMVAGPWVFWIASDNKTCVPDQARRHVLKRATLIGAAGALAVALVVIVLGQLPRASHPNPGSPSLAGDYRRADIPKLPVDFVPGP